MYKYKAGYDYQNDYIKELDLLLKTKKIDKQEYDFLVKEIRRMNEQDRNFWRKVRRNETAVDPLQIKR